MEAELIETTTTADKLKTAMQTFKQVRDPQRNKTDEKITKVALLRNVCAQAKSVLIKDPGLHHQ